jgi:hypothetical protein
MSRWTYYSPVLLGVLLVVALNDALRDRLAGYGAGLAWGVVVLVAIGVGLGCQVLTVGAQGAFAQVLPVPGGRSIRGRAAVTGGWLLILWVVLGAIAGLLGYEAVTVAALVLGGLSGLALVAALVVYIWSLPAAVADFGEGGRDEA